MTPVERAFYEYTILLSPADLLIAKISTFGQKTEPWKWARKGRMTGSTVASSVGHGYDNRPLKQAKDAAIDKPFKKPVAYGKGPSPMDWGSGKETYAGQCYINDLQRLVSKVFREQRLAFFRDPTTKDQTMTHFVFRDQRIPVPNIFIDPQVQIIAYNLLIQPMNHHRGCSPDGVVFINGMPCGCIEIKCPSPYGGNHLHPLTKSYYYDQLMAELYLTGNFWKTVGWVDAINWTTRWWYVETFVLDTEYFYEWYLPRELRYYFSAFLPLVSQHLRMSRFSLAATLLPSLQYLCDEQIYVLHAV